MKTMKIGLIVCLILEVYVPELVLNETRRDRTGGHFPNWRDHDNTEGQSRDREGELPECLRRYFSRFFREIFGSREMAFGNADLYLILTVLPNQKMPQIESHSKMTSQRKMEGG